MQSTLSIAFYVALAGLVVVLIAGIVNLARRDAGAASRSNQLMRLRVIVQGLAIALLVAIGFVAGAIRIGG